jgi:hypothetical protein
MAHNLTTRYLVKQFLGQSANRKTDDTRIDALIDPVSLAIGRYCGRTWETATYKRWLDGSGSARLLLPEWPITRLSMSSIGRRTALEVQAATSAATWASVHIASSVLTLQWIDTSGDDNTSALALGTYKTMTTLAAAINAVSGWSASIKDSLDIQPSSLIANMGEQDALSPNSADIDLPDDPISARRCSESEQAIDCGGIWPEGSNNVFVWWVAGYTLPADVAGHGGIATAGDVPADLSLVANMIIQDVLESSKDGRTMQSEKWTNYSYSKAPGMTGGDLGKFVENYAGALAPHRSMSLIA